MNNSYISENEYKNNYDTGFKHVKGEYYPIYNERRAKKASVIEWEAIHNRCFVLKLNFNDIQTSLKD